MISRNSFPNLRVTPETELYTIADFSRVWIMADVFEADIPKIHVGQTARVSLPGQPAGSFMREWIISSRSWTRRPGR